MITILLLLLLIIIMIITIMKIIMIMITMRESGCGSQRARPRRPRSVGSGIILYMYIILCYIVLYSIISYHIMSYVFYCTTLVLYGLYHYIYTFIIFKFHKLHQIPNQESVTWQGFNQIRKTYNQIHRCCRGPGRRC